MLRNACYGKACVGNAFFWRFEETPQTEQVFKRKVTTLCQPNKILCPASKGTVFSVFPYCSNLQIEHRWPGWILLILIEWFNTQTFASFIFFELLSQVQDWNVKGQPCNHVLWGNAIFGHTEKLIGSCHWINEETSAGFLKASWTTSRQVAMESMFRHFSGRCRF